jgi:alkylated DNA repair dioxygenase AlkB
MPNLEVFADKIFYYKNVIGNCKELVDLLEQIQPTLGEDNVLTQWGPWTTSDNKDFHLGWKISSNSKMYEFSTVDAKLIYDIFYTSLLFVGNDYARKNGLSIAKPSALSISKYAEGSSMGPHVDDYGTNPRVKPIMSAVLYLNDDYEGGELHFKEQGVTIKPEAGSVVIFPSVAPFYHESKEIIFGNKYMCPAFWKDII